MLKNNILKRKLHETGVQYLGEEAVHASDVEIEQEGLRQIKETAKM